MLYKSGNIAEKLNVTRQMVTYYAEQFADYLELKHEPGKHRVYTDAHLEKFKIIHNLLKKENLSTNQARDYLRTSVKIKEDLPFPKQNISFVQENIESVKEDNEGKKDLMDYLTKNIKNELVEIESFLNENVAIDILESLLKNLQKDNMLMCSIANLPFYSINGLNKETKKKFIKEIKQIIEKYQKYSLLTKEIINI